MPGFETSDEIEELSFERIDETQAIEVARAGFGVEASTAVRLDTERDDSFRLTTEHGDRVLKVAHPADDAALVGLQLRALLHASRADTSLPLQRIVSTTPDAPMHLLANGRVSWMFEWMPGVLLRDATVGVEHLAALGTTLGRLTTSLAGFEDEDARRLSAWELQTVPRLRSLLEILPDDAAAEAISRYSARVEPRLHELPAQVIHNDFNTGNVLVDPGAPQFVVGILDFGDVVHSLRVADLAVALSYQLAPLGHALENLEPMITAFDRQVGLRAAEREALPDLVAARFAQRILVRAWLARNGQDRDGQHDENVSALTALLNLEA